MKRYIDKEKIIRKNPKIDRAIVSDYEKIDEDLRRMGLDTRPKYRFGIPITDKTRNPPLMVTSSRKKSSTS